MIDRRRAMMFGDTRQYLYRDGDQCVDITGGWTSYIDRNNAYVHFNNANIETQSVFSYADFGANVLLYTVNKIDISNAKKLFVHLPVVIRSGVDTYQEQYIPRIELFLTSEIPSLKYWQQSNFDYSTSFEIKTVETKNDITINIELNHIIGFYYVGIRNITSNFGPQNTSKSFLTATVDNFWLE